MSEKLLLKPCEVAQLTGLGRSTTYALIRSGVIPSIKIGSGRLIRVPLDALRRWIEGCLSEPGDQRKVD